MAVFAPVRRLGFCLLVSWPKFPDTAPADWQRLSRISETNMAIAFQSRTQSPQAFWSAGRRQERLWDNGISYPRKRGIPVLVRMLKIKTEVKCFKIAAVLLLLGLKVLSGKKCSRKPKLILTRDQKELDFFPVRADQSNWNFFSCKSERKEDLIGRCYNRQVTYFFITVYTYK